MTKLDHRGVMAALCTAVLGAVLLALVLTASADASFPGTNGKIAFHRDGDIWTIIGDGTGVTKLTTNYNGEYNPAVSPDGSRIAYEFLRGIWVMNADGSDRRCSRTAMRPTRTRRGLRTEPGSPSPDTVATSGL